MFEAISSPLEKHQAAFSGALTVMLREGCIFFFPTLVLLFSKLEILAIHNSTLDSNLDLSVLHPK